MEAMGKILELVVKFESGNNQQTSKEKKEEKEKNSKSNKY